MLLIFLSHPIQHYVPWFAELHRQLGGDMKVVFATRHGLDCVSDREFGESFAWDMDLTQGYTHEFYTQSNTGLSPDRGFWGIRFPRVESYIRKNQPDAVMIFGWLYAGYWEVARAAAKLGIPYILRGESNLLNRGGWFKWMVKNQTAGRLCRGAASCLAIGQRNQSLFRAYGVPEERIQVAPYFVDNAFFAGESDRLRTERRILREHFGLSRDAFVFLFMGKMILKKHPDHLLRAWQSLPEASRSKSAVLFAGSGAMMNRLKTQTAGDPRVAFTGFLNRKKLPEAYAACDVLVLPSDEGETWGLVINEAMASRLPVIVSNRVGCVPDLVLENQTGRSYPYGDLDALRKIMTEFIDNSEAVSNMGDRAREHISLASAQYAADTVADVLRVVRKASGSRYERRTIN